MNETILPWAVLAAWALYGAIGPWRFASGRNRHNALAVWLRPETPGQHQPGINVQEKGEWRLHKLIGLAIGAPATWIASHFDPVAALVCAVLVTLAADNLTRTIPQIDWAGHGAEVLVAEDAGLASYRTQEAARVARDYQATIADALEWFDQMHWLSRIIRALGY